MNGADKMRGAAIRSLFLVLSLSPVPCLAAEPDKPALDEAAVAWKKDEERRLAGLRQAENFRLTLLEGNGKQQLSAATVGRALELFRIRYEKPLQGRPALSRFAVTAQQFAQQLQGVQRLDAQRAFAPFAGRWYGVWDQKQVDHHWHPARHARQQPLSGRPGLLLAEQYAWIGDGFGWNFLVRPQGSSGEAVSGYVYHVTARDPRSIRDEFPLVGYLDGPGRLIWVTPFAVFFEEVLGEEKPAQAPALPQRYVITGFNFKAQAGELASAGPGYQALYTRHPEDRPPFQRFAVELTASQ